MVQVREKEADTGDFLGIALKTQQLCNSYGVPVIINDRVDIALAINAFGIHLGQVGGHLSWHILRLIFLLR